MTEPPIPAEAIGELDRELADLHRRFPTAEMTEAAQNMVRQLHIAVHGATWAQPESPREVWRKLLAEAMTLRAQGAAAERQRILSTNRPRIVCLCGSTRFGNFFHAANLKQTLAGEIVLSIGCDTKSDADLAAVGELNADLNKAGLDELHKRKIDLADYVLVVSDAAGYFGESTWGEIQYAWQHDKPVEFVEPAAKARALALAEGVFA